MPDPGPTSIAHSVAAPAATSCRKASTIQSRREQCNQRRVGLRELYSVSCNSANSISEDITFCSIYLKATALIDGARPFFLEGPENGSDQAMLSISVRAKGTLQVDGDPQKASSDLAA